MCLIIPYVGTHDYPSEAYYVGPNDFYVGTHIGSYVTKLIRLRVLQKGTIFHPYRAAYSSGAYVKPLECYCLLLLPHKMTCITVTIISAQ